MWYRKYKSGDVRQSLTAGYNGLANEPSLKDAYTQKQKPHFHLKKKKTIKGTYRAYSGSHIHINYIITFLSFNFYYLFLI